MTQNDEHKEHHIGYGTYVLVWVGLLALTSLTVTVAGVNFGMYTLFIALFVAAVKSSLVINVFMHIKFGDPIFKVFLAVSGATLLVIFILTFVDYSFRG